jgi:phosphatidylglycerophosphate synthase
MSIHVHALGQAPVSLWHLDARERLHRMVAQLPGLSWCEDPTVLPADARLLLVRADYLFDVRTLKALAERGSVALRCERDGRLAAAIVDAGQWQRTRAMLLEQAPPPDGLDVVGSAQLGGFNRQLRRHDAPLLEPITEADRSRLENRLYGNAYKGITDLVTKWLWPNPARHGVRLCARLGITPNMVTAFGVLLMLAASWLFLHGHYAIGLALGWLMTYLDTVDGKLARVTVRASKIGHAMDHGMDLIHPPFWYILWGMSLTAFEPVFGLDQTALYWAIALGYVVGRLVEGVFDHFLRCSVFVWRPFDSYFRLITARRNPCMILLTAAVLVGRPDWGFIAVAAWTVLTTGVLLVRMLQGIAHRLTRGRLVSWLADESSARSQHPRAFRTFSGTRAAYADADA